MMIKLLFDDNLVLICYENLLTIFNIVNLFWIINEVEKYQYK